MRYWSADLVARAAGARLIAPPECAGGPEPAGPERAVGPERVVIDSRDAGPGALFVGLRGESLDGGRFAADALSAGAWGVLVAPEHVPDGGGVVLAAERPLEALQRLATAWRRHLGAKVIGVTGSTGKTSTKDILAAILSPARRTVASRANFNTEIGLPLEILSAPAGTEVLVLEMAMRGGGQIAELAGIAEPDVGVIVNVGPVHLELLETIEAIAATKAELIAALPPGGTAIVPAGEPLLDPYRRGDLRIVTFGDGGDVRLLASDPSTVQISHGDHVITLEVPFTQAHLRSNLVAAVAAAEAVGVRPDGRLEVSLPAGRGQRHELPDGLTLIDDCYNANPMSMRAALDDLAVSAGTGTRRVAVLGDMLELGPRGRDFHVEIGEHAAGAGVELLITVGPLAAAMTDRFGGEAHAVADAGEAAALLGELLVPGDTVLVKGSRGVGLELVCQTLREGSPA